MRLFQGWSDGSFKDLLTLLKDMLPQANVVHETIYEAKHLIYQLGLNVEKSMCARMITFYIMGLSMRTLRKAFFADSTDSIIKKMAVMTRTATEENAGLQRCFGTFLSFVV
jgi:hypothetical protein